MKTDFLKVEQSFNECVTVINSLKIFDATARRDSMEQQLKEKKEASYKLAASIELTAQLVKELKYEHKDNK